MQQCLIPPMRARLLESQSSSHQCSMHTHTHIQKGAEFFPAHTRIRTHANTSETKGVQTTDKHGRYADQKRACSQLCMSTSTRLTSCDACSASSSASCGLTLKKTNSFVVTACHQRCPKWKMQEGMHKRTQNDDDARRRGR